MQYVIAGKLEKIEITEERKSPIFLNNLEIAVVNILEFGLPELSFSRLLFFFQWTIHPEVLPSE